MLEPADAPLFYLPEKIRTMCFLGNKTKIGKCRSETNGRDGVHVQGLKQSDAAQFSLCLLHENNNETEKREYTLARLPRTLEL